MYFFNKPITLLSSIYMTTESGTALVEVIDLKSFFFTQVNRVERCK